MQSRADKNDSIRRRLITLAIASALAANAGALLAQESDEDDESTQLEEVVVTGIRGSLNQAMDIKRDSAGVVEAITAEDIGKFPDTNLAESLQRVTGVSIDRRNNEGNQISVRGLGPSFNLVTLNGRQMPVASSPEQETISSATQSRAFNFAEIASESVSGVRVHKTVRADLPTGGIGATVDILTARPFTTGNKAILTLGGTHDSSVEDGSSVTPEIGGLWSMMLSDNFGILINGSVSQRDFTDREEHHDGWQRITPEANSNEFAALSAGADLTGVTQLYRPITNISEISENERERINGQFVAQFRPTDGFEVTLDYTLSRFERDERRYQTGVFGDPSNHGVQSLSFDQNGTFTDYAFTGAADFLSYENELQIENDSIGLNLDWQVNQALNLNFDAHSSESQSQPDGELNDLLFLLQGSQGAGFSFGYGGEPFRVDVADDNVGTLLFDNTPGGLVFIPAGGAEEPLPLNGFLDPTGFAPLGTFVRNIAVENTVDQAQLRGTYEFLDNSSGLMSVDFGAGFTDYEVDTRSVSSAFVFQGLGVNPFTFADVCRTAICPLDSPLRSGIQVGGGSGIAGFPQIPIVGSPAELAAGFPITPDSIVPATDQSIISEESTSFHLNFNFEWTFGDMPARLAAGFRYEDSEISGTSVQNLPVALQTSSNTEQEVIQSTEEVDFTLDGDYSEFLPAIDFQLSTTENTVARISYGRSLARPDLNALRPSLTIADTRPFGPFNAVQGNPNLQPYLADNIDLAFEWYYSEGSYFAINYFYKDIENYIGTQTVTQPILNVDGQPLTDPSARFMGTPVVGTPSDPVANFNVLLPFNSGSADLDGIEIAVQHLFGDSGFGIQANYTTVDSDAEFDPAALTQTVNLIGLSDSANVVGFYENDTFQVRVALNWRDEFLFSENQLRVQGEPVFFDSYTQVDLSGSWYINERLTAFVEVLNLTGEDQTQYGRYRNQFLFENDQDARFNFGVRATW